MKNFKHKNFPKYERNTIPCVVNSSKSVEFYDLFTSLLISVNLLLIHKKKVFMIYTIL